MVSRGNAQITGPSCNASLDYGWSYNSLSQDPCVVTTYLVESCDGNFVIPPLNSDQHYGGPDGSTAQNNPCQCNSVTYMLLSACGACQGGSFISWSAYNDNCSTVYSGLFPQAIPAATRVPHWAYTDATAELIFNATEAQQVGDMPESTGAPSPTESSSSSASPTVTVTVTPNKKSDAGAISGGVIGGAVVIFIAAVVVMYLRRRQRRRRGARKAPSNMVDLAETRPRPHFGSTMVSHPNTSTGFHASIPTMSAVSASPPKLYNPSDPSTFPSADIPAPALQPLAYRPEGGGHSPQSSETGNTSYFSPLSYPVQPNR